MVEAAEKVRIAPRAVAKYFAHISIIFVAYFVAGKLGQATANIRSSNLGPVWPAYGVALAAVLLGGYRVWVAIAASAFLVAFLSPVPHVAAVGQAAGATLAALTGALLLRIAKFHPSLARLHDALGLTVLGAVGSAMVSASIGVSVLYATHVQAYSGVGSAWLIYWLGDSTGVLLITPLVLTFPDLLRIRPRHRILEFVVLLLLLTLACFIIFGDLPLIPIKLHILAFAVLPFVMWAAIRFGVSGAALSTLVVATIATVETAVGSGPFAQNTPFTNAVLLDVFFAVLSVSGMTLAAVIAEREHAEREREQAVREQAAMEARLRLATIVESSDDAIIGEDIDGTVTDWNKGAERLYGYSASEVIGKPFSFLTPMDHSDDFPEIMRKLKNGEAVKHHETVRQRKDGTRVAVSLTISPIIDAEGRIVGASAIDRDITERKRAEDARFKHAAIVESSDDAIISKNLDGVIVSWNTGAQRIFGFTEAEAVGQPIAIIIPPELREEESTILQRLRNGERIEHHETTRITKEGKKVSVSLMICPIKDSTGRIVGASKIARDITERKQTQDRLRESEERLRLAVEAGRMYAFEWDAATDLIVRSGQCADILGWTDDPFHDSGRQFAARVHPDDRERYTASTETGLTAENPTYQTSYRVSGPDGRIIWLAESGRAFFDGQGRMLHTIGMAADATDSKLAEEALSNVSRRLIEAQEQERTRIARDLHDDISQQLALLSVEMEQLRQNPPGSAAEVANRMGELSKRTHEITADVQSMSHHLHSSKLEYLGLVAAIRSFCKEFGEQQKVQIDFSAEHISSTVPQAISLSLFRVVQEALQNAVKHSGMRHFAVKLQSTSDEVHLTVSDSGAGFDPEEAMNDRGLGLISMRERIRLVHGTVSIVSKPMGGTTIHARVPLISGSNSMRAAG